jgi:hypothetical protein
MSETQKKKKKTRSRPKPSRHQQITKQETPRHAKILITANQNY